MRKLLHLLRKNVAFGVGNSELDRQQTLSDPQVFRAAFTAPGVNFDFVRNPLTFSQAGKSRAFDGADVNEHIVSAFVGLNKAKTLLAIEPLNSARRHFLLQSVSRVSITRFHSTGDVFRKEPAGNFRKGQRLIEFQESTGFRSKIQAARDIYGRRSADQSSCVTSFLAVARSERSVAIARGA